MSKTPYPKAYWHMLRQWFAARSVFVGILVIFAIGASWVAISSHYPMAFDEDYHLGIIKIFARQSHPFMSSQPPSYDVHGALVHNPSYMYHWLMSMPWRLITALTDSFMMQLIIMRLLNVGMFVLALVVWRRALLAARASPALANWVLAVLALTPVLSQVAGQVNYDNLMFLGCGVYVYLALRIYQALRKEQAIPALPFMALLAAGMFTSLVKYPFVPLFAVVTLYLLTIWSLQRRPLKHWWRTVVTSFRAANRFAKYSLLAVLVVTGGLFAERYVLNVARYHTPVPECDQVLSIERCQSYSPWKRNYDFDQAKLASFRPDPWDFTQFWLRRMAGNMVFAVNGPDSHYTVGPPLIVPRLTLYLFSFLGLAALAWRFRVLWRQPATRLAITAAGLYILSLYLQNFSEYANLGRAVAVQGRYLLPILPLLYLVCAQALALVLQRRPRLQLVAAAVVLIGLLAGGGALTYILRADATWYW